MRSKKESEKSRSDESEVMLNLLRKNLQRPQEKDRVFSARTLIESADCTVNDLMQILLKVPRLRMETAQKLFLHPDVTDRNIIEAVEMYPEDLAFMAWETVLDRHEPTKDILSRLRIIMLQQGYTDIEAVSTHHYWWPGYAWGHAKRRITMNIKHLLHIKYHRHFLKKCKLPTKRKCHKQPCKYSDLCCYHQKNLKFPEPQPQA